MLAPHLESLKAEIFNESGCYLQVALLLWRILTPYNMAYPSRAVASVIL